MRGAITHLKKADPVLKPWIERIGPFRMAYRDPEFSTMVRSVLSQQVSGAAAKTVYRRVEEAVRGDVSAKRILRLGFDKLRLCGLSGQKTTYILNLAEHVASGALQFESLADLPDEEVIASLTQVKGIGVWTAQMYLMFALRRPNVLPANDLGIRAGFKRVHGLDAMPSVKEVAEYGRIWEPYCSVACWYLWRSLDSDAEL